MSKKKRIGILTSGGDCAGLNAALRAVVYAATGRGWEVVGIEDGTAGLLTTPRRFKVLTREMFDATVMRLGGTILGTTNKGNPFKFAMPDGSFKDLSDDIIAGIRDLEIDTLIGIGGDGSMEILKTLATRGGFKLIGIPKTMDNDVGKTEISIGFETAAYVATEALDRLQPTAASHDRVMVLEVMGRDAGHVALSCGVAGGADVILLPEIPYDIQKVTAKIRQIRDDGRNFALVVVSEAAKQKGGAGLKVELSGGEMRYGGVGHYVGAQISEATGFETRVTVLGHVLRGAPPIHTDRVLAAAFGVHAVELVAQGKSNRLVAWSNRQVIDVAIEDAIASYQAVDLDGALVKTARALGVCLGD